MRLPRIRLLVLLVAALLALGTGVASATPPRGPATGEFAPLDRPGPRLSVSPAQLQAALHCNGPLTGLTRDPVLLVPGTTLTPEVNFGWNYLRAFDQDGRRWCTVTLPHDATGDIQVAAEYVVHALRSVSAAAHRDVDVVGFSQGGMVPRWALRFWPDTRDLVDDLVGLSPSNHGTVLADVACTRPCNPSFHQQASRSRFLQALNSGVETFAGIDYTVAYTQTDEVVVPNAGPAPSSALRTGAGAVANIALQEVCPGHLADHFLIGSSDAVGHAIVVDALDNDGPAVASRIPRTVCALPFHRGVDPLTAVPDFLAMVAYAGDPAGNAPDVPAEPPLAPYVLRR
ncbi:triacylglycerol lipase [Blastococcus sp. TF02A-26]|uniref:esterase/lipase family protein n=1 Tax=Blastococcus sp. TF02A-26 TaxID=2250577 RepID=UPI000DEB7377|nr:lipase [Blastococcus sp. TF02A-26]RBY85389.1 lipase [Blastococcus sp. TF02A-26]